MSDKVNIPASTQEPKKKSNRLIIIILALLLLLLVPIGFYLGMNTGANQVEKAYEKENEQDLNVKQVQEKSDSLFRALQGELEFYKNQADSLYPEVSAREEELEKQYIKIQNLIRQTKQGSGDEELYEVKMKELRTELNRLRKFVDDQTLDLAELRRANAKLAEEREEFKELYKEEQADKNRLEEDYNVLSAQTDELAAKVDLASVLKVANVNAIGAKLTPKGTDKEVNRAKKVEFIKVCFNVVRNEVVRPGINKMYLRIIDPTGWPIVVESRGSAKIANVNTGKEEYFTTMKSFNYNPSFSDMCLTWSQVPSKPFESGVYHIELYNKGHKIGKTTLALR